MAAYKELSLLGSVLAVLATQVSAEDVCYIGGFYINCKDGYRCCDNNTQCCKIGLTVGAIIGLIIGLILFVGCVATIIFLVFKKKNNAQGRIFAHPMNHQTVTVASVHPIYYGQSYGMNRMDYGQNYGQNYGQPSYGQPSSFNNVPASPFAPQSAPPPSYGLAKAQNPAYPPNY